MIVVRNALVAGQSLTWPDGTAAAKLAEQLRKLEYPSNIVSRQYAAIVAAFSSLSLVRDFADRGSFQNLVFSSPLLEVEMILEAALYLSFAAVVGIVKAYRRRQDVLYGAYISQNDRKK